MAKISGVTFILINRLSLILMQLRDSHSKFYPNQWCFPGGASDSDESPVQTVIREVKEEYDIELEKEDCRFLTMNELPDISQLVSVFICRVKDDRKACLREGAEMRWMSIDEIKKLELGFNHGGLVRKIISYLESDHISPSEPPFIPKPGQTDYTNIKRVPVVNCVVEYKGKILLVKRNQGMRFYGGYWHCIGGFLDDAKSPVEKAREELSEELGLKPQDITAFSEGESFEREDPTYAKTWIVHPVLARVTTDRLKLDWEAEEYRWIKPEELEDFKTIPGLNRVVATLLRR